MSRYQSLLCIKMIHEWHLFPIYHQPLRSRGAQDASSRFIDVPSLLLELSFQFSGSIPTALYGGSTPYHCPIWWVHPPTTALYGGSTPPLPYMMGASPLPLPYTVGPTPSLLYDVCTAPYHPNFLPSSGLAYSASSPRLLHPLIPGEEGNSLLPCRIPFLQRGVL